MSTTLNPRYSSSTQTWQNGRSFTVSPSVANDPALNIVMPHRDLHCGLLVSGFHRRADRFALTLTGRPAAFVTAMRRLGAQNLTEEHIAAARAAGSV